MAGRAKGDEVIVGNRSLPHLNLKKGIVHPLFFQIRN